MGPEAFYLATLVDNRYWRSPLPLPTLLYALGGIRARELVQAQPVMEEHY